MMLLLALSLAVAPPSSTSFSGIGRAKDGDSLMVDDVEVRLFGIDAPELDQRCKKQGQEWACGREAATQLDNLLRGKTVRCEKTGTDRFGRTLARCLAGSTDLNRVMVGLGYAVAFRRYSTDYVSAEESAKVNRRGLWAGIFQMPADYRSAESAEPRREKAAPQTRKPSRAVSSNWAGRAAANCNIKGNQNRKGQWIYHMPGMPYYDQTRPEEIFCTEAEAQAAGYRRAIVK